MVGLVTDQATRVDRVGDKARMMDLDQIMEGFDSRRQGTEKESELEGTCSDLNLWKMTPTVMFRKVNI